MVIVGQILLILITNMTKQCLFKLGFGACRIKGTQKYLPLVIKIECDSQEWHFSVSCYLIWGLSHIFFVFTWTWSVMGTTDLIALWIASDFFPEQIPPVSWRKIGPGVGREVLHNYIIQGLCQNSWRQGTFIKFWLTLQRLSAWDFL